MAEKKLKTLQFEGLNTTYVLPEVDPTSSISGDAADAKIVGDHLTDINNPHGVTLEQLGASKTIVTDENEDGHIILKSYLSDSGSGNISTHISDRSNPHKVTAVQVGADVSGAAKQALEDAKGYTDEVITNLIGGAPDTLNTLQELAEAMEANAEVVDVLEKAITGKADNSALTAHIDNKNNPHNITIEQIGAAPVSMMSEYTVVSASQTLDAMVENQFGKTANQSMRNFMFNNGVPNAIPAAVWAATIYKYADGHGKIEIRHIYNAEGHEFVRFRNADGWGDWIRTDPSAFAPSGYGNYGMVLPPLGSYSTEAELESALSTVLAEMKNGEIRRYSSVVLAFGNVTVGEWAQATTVYKTSAAYAIVTMESGFGKRVCRVTKAYSNGVWQPAEWVNPPMQPGVEYRTTERYQGNSVYTKLVDLGASENGKVIQVLNSGMKMIRHEDRCTSYPLPHINGTLDSAWTYYLMPDQEGFALKMFCGSNATGKQTYSTVYYYKE